MDSQRLQLLLEEIEANINDFKKEIAISEDHYRELLKLITDPKLSSSLIERQAAHVEHQKAALTEMEDLHNQVQDQLAELNKSN